MKGVPSKDSNNVEPYFFVWCDQTGLNDGSALDDGELQGATISSYVLEVVSGDIVIDSHNKSAVTIHGVGYAVNTVVTIWTSGGTTKTLVRCRVTLSDNRVLDETMIIPIKTH